MMFKKLAAKLASDREKWSYSVNPIESKSFLGKLTNSALDLYERQSDIKKFTQLVLSDPENNSQDKLVDALFSHGIISVNKEKENLIKLTDNSRFLRDLGLVEKSLPVNS